MSWRLLFLKCTIVQLGHVFHRTRIYRVLPPIIRFCAGYKHWFFSCTNCESTPGGCKQTINSYLIYLYIVRIYQTGKSPKVAIPIKTCRKMQAIIWNSCPNSFFLRMGERDIFVINQVNIVKKCENSLIILTFGKRKVYSVIPWITKMHLQRL